MENLIIFIIVIIFSVLRSLAESRQAAGRRPVSKPGGLPMSPVPGTRSLTPEFLETVFAPEALKQEKVLRPEKTQEAFQSPVQTVPTPVRKPDIVFMQDKLFQPQAETLLQGIVYAEVLGLPRVKKPWQPRK